VTKCVDFFIDIAMSMRQ